jgi:rfaE bifunctional protein kinase chain/domain
LDSDFFLKFYLCRTKTKGMSSKTNLQQILDEFTTKKILIVGDVMVDEYLWGTVSRISPEAPVQVVQCTEREHRMGGAANVAINIRSFGALPIMCSVIGRDETGIIYKRLLERLMMTDEGIIESDKRITTVKTRVIGNHQHLLRVDQEITNFLDRELETRLIERIEKIIKKNSIDAIIFQDYDKGVLTSSIIKMVTELANVKKIPTLVDPKKRSFLNYKNVTLFKPNFHELTEGLGLSFPKTDHEALFDAAKKLHTENSIKNIMVTLSEKGVFISNGREYRIMPAEERDITDVSGAGDTVISVAALSLASGLSTFQAAALANLAGGLVCEKVGVIPIEPELLLKEDFTLPED